MTSAPTSTQQTPRLAGILLNLIATLLAPMFLCVTNGDVALARAVAAETVTDFHASGQADLLAIGQIIACGLASICAIGTSMQDGTTADDRVRLHRLALGFDRAAERNRRTLGKHGRGHAAPSRATVIVAPPVDMPGHADPAPCHDDAPGGETSPAADEDFQPEPSLFLTAEAEALLAAESRARLRLGLGHDEHPAAEPAAANDTGANGQGVQHQWANAMVAEAEAVIAEIATLPAPERKAASLRASFLSTTASELLAGPSSLPGELNLVPPAQLPMKHARTGK